MNVILFIIGIIVVIAIVATGGFGILQNNSFGLHLFSSGPLSSGPGSGGWFGGFGSYSGGNIPATNEIKSGSYNNSASSKNLPADKTRISISSITHGAQKPNDEYVTLYYSAESNRAPVDITGWTIGNTQGHRYAIGVGYKLALDSAESSVWLLPGATAYVHSGKSPINENFLETACTAYLNEGRSFNPSIGGSCPRIDTQSLVYMNDACLTFLNGLSSCYQASISGNNAVGIGDECSNFATKHYSYRGCIDDFRFASDFYKTTWQVYLGRPETLWRAGHDLITLYDADGHIVSTYQY
ncbi:MAG: lamin tail domain-containing protein [Candidatus Sungbacteria bacterium]|uniref:Lamin tail domain-containing protein n=1 Tax=Candidatus Sungiibacteriota bacterium TaxID=2750080 RepID=A0A9D6QU47_9BACT|nr:lamin tail domain-containing protein [Candidatus Sungbacteria bacterium]